MLLSSHLFLLNLLLFISVPAAVLLRCAYQARKGEPHILRVDLDATHPDNEDNVKYILSFQSAESLAEWTGLFASLADAAS